MIVGVIIRRYEIYPKNLGSDKLEVIIFVRVIGYVHGEFSDILIKASYG